MERAFITMTPTTLNRLDEYAGERPRSHVIEEAVVEYLEKHEGADPSKSRPNIPTMRTDDSLSIRAS